MKSNYRRIGDYIRLVDERNAGLKVKMLLGLSISKEFIPSVANIIGSDMENYKVIRKNQFACSLMQVRRDKKMPVALLKDFDEAIISQAYPVFEITNENELLPDYLMMWMIRSEFDREACFYAVGGVRGSLEWEDFCNMKLPVPSIEKQREIVKEYEAIVNRIKLNEKLNKKLEETAQAIYRQWFVDFEFPDENGNPYKSSGGEMVWSEELGKEIPMEWDIDECGNVFDFKTGKLNSNAAVEKGTYPFFTCSSETFKINTYSFDCEALLLAGNNASAVYPFKYYKGKFDAYQRTYVITPKSSAVSIYQGFFEILKQLEGFKGTSSGTATKFLTMKMLGPIELLVPKNSEAKGFEKLCAPLFSSRQILYKAKEQLLDLQSSILSKMTTVEER
jgi:type I restriction enzyme S subunit